MLPLQGHMDAQGVQNFSRRAEMSSRRPISIGQKFNKLTVLKFVGPSNHPQSVLLCQCECGNKKVANAREVWRGKTKACGCLMSAGTHQMTGTPTYRTWKAMKQRCFNKKHPQRKQYGGRGITVCERWKNSFELFLADMGEAPKGKSIDRINNDGNYEPGNCRWATAKQQSRNNSGNKNITFNGITLCQNAWAEKLGICGPTLRHRLANWEFADALTLLPSTIRYKPRKLKEAA